MFVQYWQRKHREQGKPWPSANEDGGTIHEDEGKYWLPNPPWMAEIDSPGPNDPDRSFTYNIETGDRGFVCG
jgi:hypothetical protein